LVRIKSITKKLVTIKSITKKLVTIKLITKKLVTIRLKINFGQKENSSFDGDFSGQNFISANY